MTQLPLPEPGMMAAAPQQRKLELFCRVAIAGSICAILYAVWAPHMRDAAMWNKHELRVLPRMCVFVLAALMAMIIQGAKPRVAFLLGSTALLGVLSVWLLFESDAGGLLYGKALSPAMVLVAPQVQLLGFMSLLLCAIFLGTALGRQLTTSLHFVTFILCAAAGDIWLNNRQVVDSVDSSNVLRLLRLPWPVQAGKLAVSPAFTDILTLAAIIEAGRNMKLHVLSVVLGAVAGYCAGSFLAVSALNWIALSMVMFSSGVLIGCWPDLRCTYLDIAKAVTISVLLFAILIGISKLHAKLNTPDKPIDPARLRTVI
jgi:hypothetical protein